MNHNINRTTLWPLPNLNIAQAIANDGENTDNYYSTLFIVRLRPIQIQDLQENAVIYPSRVFLHTGVVERMENGYKLAVLIHSLVINIPVQPAPTIPLAFLVQTQLSTSSTHHV